MSTAVTIQALQPLVDIFEVTQESMNSCQTDVEGALKAQTEFQKMAQATLLEREQKFTELTAKVQALNAQKEKLIKQEETAVKAQMQVVLQLKSSFAEENFLIEKRLALGDTKTPADFVHVFSFFSGAQLVGPEKYEDRLLSVRKTDAMKGAFLRTWVIFNAESIHTIEFVSQTRIAVYPPELEFCTEVTAVKLQPPAPCPPLPSQLWSLLKIRSLDLSRHGLASLPKEIGNLKKLYRVILCDNQLTQFPDEFYGLENLTEIDIKGNKFTQLSPKTLDFKKLGKIGIGGNPLSEIPSFERKMVVAIDLSQRAKFAPFILAHPEWTFKDLV